MQFTYDAMLTFHNLGRNGWDGLGGPAKVVVDEYNYPTEGDEAKFNRSASSRAPENSVVVLKKISRPYSVAAGIDIIGHEWGHGVVYTSANFPDDPSQPKPVGAQLHEGFADVIGYINEWSPQIPGSGPERADWMAGEDSFSNGHWDRRVDDANWPSWLPTYARYYFHKNDHPSDQEAHRRGNMLPVAFRLLDVGGQNPICSRPGWSGEGCTISVNGQGLSKAENIFFHTLTHMCTSTTQWEDLPDLMMWSAFRLYGHCTPGKPGNPALEEQHAVDDAFTAIGYPGPGDYYECPS